MNNNIFLTLQVFFRMQLHHPQVSGKLASELQLVSEMGLWWHLGAYTHQLLGKQKELI